MEDQPLPYEMERVERLLSRDPRPVPSAAMRRRVLGGVQSQLRRDRMLPKFRFALAFVGRFFLAMNLLLGVLGSNSFALQPSEPNPSVSEVARRLQELSPGLS